MKMDIMYMICLSVFFILCGCFLEKKELNKEYVNEQFKRCMPPFFWLCFSVLIYDLINQIVVKGNANIHNMTDVIASDLTRFFFASATRGNLGDIQIETMRGPLWIFPTTFFAFIIVQFVLNKIKKSYMQWGLIICGALLSYYSLEFICFPFNLQLSMISSAFIILGYILKEYNVFYLQKIVQYLRQSFQCLIQKTGLLKTKSKEQPCTTKRDCTIDLEKGVLIIIMLIGHYSIDRDLRNMIYSFHMMAFVFLSGYFYKKKDSICKTILHTAKVFLIPYVAFAALHILYHGEDLSEVWRKYILGMSFSKDWFVDIPSIGPVYFILLLFCVRILYVFIDRWIEKDSYKFAAVLLISYVGMRLGLEGKWLPWSFDCAMYAVVFYMAGYHCRKYEIIKFLKENLMLYFVLSSIWAFMIYKGSMEIAIRDYGIFILGILGALSATLLLYLLCSYIKEYLPKAISQAGACIGENTLYILIIHTVFGGVISAWIGQFFDPQYVYHMVAHIFVQVVLGVLVGQIIAFVKTTIIRKK